ncbi:MAG: THC0290_0291 family protein [Marinirhabdus sp.]
MNVKILLGVFVLCAATVQQMHGQSGFSHELGVIFGPVSFSSDFGKGANFNVKTGNVGLGIGAVHYINFSYDGKLHRYTRATYFNYHFKIRNELSYHKTNFEHLGPRANPDDTSLFADQLRSMRGSSQVIDVGSQLEYYPFKIRDYALTGVYRVFPFVSFGLHYVSYDPEVSSALGDLSTLAPNAATPPKYVNSFQNEPGATFSFVFSLGTRIKLDPLTDLMVDFRGQHYLSDYVDGLNPRFEENGLVGVPENRSNDWAYWLNAGVVFYLN